MKSDTENPIPSNNDAPIIEIIADEKRPAGRGKPLHFPEREPRGPMVAADIKICKGFAVVGGVTRK